MGLYKKFDAYRLQEQGYGIGPGLGTVLRACGVDPSQSRSELR